MVRFSRRWLLLFGLWLLLTDAEPAGLPFGVVAAVAGALAVPGGGAWPISPAGWLRFVPWFVGRSVAGGVDVLRRAVSPGRPLDPDWVTFDTTLNTPPARHLLAATVSLLPGTLVARLDGQRLTIHVLDRKLPILRDLHALEARIAGLYAGEEQ
mgnify:FL=1